MFGLLFEKLSVFSFKIESVELSFKGEFIFYLVKFIDELNEFVVGDLMEDDC